MRIRLPLGRSLFFACAFLFALVALLPLRLALHWFGLDSHGFTARQARGSVWLGGLSEAQFGSVALGDLQTRLSSLPLIIGRARIDLKRNDPSNPLTGATTVARHSFGLDDMSARLDVGSAFAPLPIASLDFSQVTAHFVDGACGMASGLVKATIAGDVAGIQLPGGLSGNARCDNGALLLPLVSPPGTEALNLRLRQDGNYQVQLAVRPSDDAMRDRLVASGFQLGATGYVLNADGTF